MNRPKMALEVMLQPLSALYSSIMTARNYAFTNGFLKSGGGDLPVISIGNLTAGGTGKTPITALFIEELLKAGKKPGLLSRGYGGFAKGASVVSSDGSVASASLFGDEMTWLAHRFPTVPAVVSRDRVLGARLLKENGLCDFIIADDAFQHRWLKREIDLVVLDATEPRWHYQSLPLGRMREGFESLSRAHGILMTKTNLAERDQLVWLRAQAAKFNLPTYEFELRIEFFSSLLDGAIERAELFKDRKVFLVSGIGRPSTFKQLVFLATQSQIVDHRIFGDHHAYSQDDLKAVEREAMAKGASAIVVTEKDAVKMADWKSRLPVYVSRLETRPLQDLGALYADFSRLLL